MSLSKGEVLVQTAQREILESYRKEFDQLCSAFRDLEGKAQGTAALAGAFLATGLTLFNRPGGLSDTLLELLLLLAVTGLSGTILFSVLALRVRQLRSCPSGENVATILHDLRKVDDETELAERLIYFYGDTASLWRECVADRKAANSVKARYIWVAQLCLTAAAACVVAIIVILILRP